MKQLFCILLLTLMTTTGYAAVEKRYVSDQLWLQLRSGPGNEFRIIKTLSSGAHLVFIEETESGTYAKVNAGKDKAGKIIEGWVLSQFLVSEPVAKEKLIFSQRKLKKVQAELNTLKQKTELLTKEKSTLSGDRSSLSREKKSLEKELKRITDISANALQLDSKNIKLTKRNQELEIQLETLTVDNTRLKDDKERTFMIIGGALIILGIILGLAIPAMRGGRKTGGWS
ncbi:MAG: TIGR04211 family SH3 domain-containing protein [Oleispira sp.]|nr:TIGR04211 family SH3 domain-containing protein [Oleispira sp.]